MTKYAYRYPDGSVGFALLFVRVGCAFVAVGVSQAMPGIPVGAPLLHLAAGVVALLLALGFATRFAAVFLGIALVVAMLTSGPIQLLLLAGHIGGCIALVMIGAGAFSIDARRHGRRVIQLQAKPPDRGVND